MHRLENRSCRREAERSFTLIEMLTAVTIGVLIVVILLGMIGQVSGIYRRSTGKIEAFQSARVGFDLMVRNLSQATLNTYLDYDNDAAPTTYLRKSELRFVIAASGSEETPGTANTGEAVFFQAPLHYVVDTADYGGTDSLLNACGYYVSFTTNSTLPPHVSSLSNPYRYRLMQMLVPAESNTVYASGGTTSWFTGSAPLADVTPVADNVIALLIRPQDPASTPPDVTPDYTDDTLLDATNSPQPATANQLPPVLQVTLVAIDEASAKRLENGSTPPAAITSAMNGKFQTVADYQADLDALQTALTAAHIQYRVFSSTVPLRESKWTK